MRKQKEDISVRFLYGTPLGRMILKGLVSPSLSRKVGRFLDSEGSKWLIPKFIKNNQIDMTEYEEREYKSFNDFFTRNVKEGARTIDQMPSHFISPCDGFLSAYPIEADSYFEIKNSRYRVADLVDSKQLESHYQGGICLVFRLTPQNYHRYCYVDDGQKGDNFYIPGQLHCVRPLACEKYPVFIRNCREYTVMETKHFGVITQIEVGALLVGKITNLKHKGAIKRGEEKGYFEFGGSTIIMLVQKDKVIINDAIWENTQRGAETAVQMGQVIGKLKD